MKTLTMLSIAAAAALVGCDAKAPPAAPSAESPPAAVAPVPPVPSPPAPNVAAPPLRETVPPAPRRAPEPTASIDSGNEAPDEQAPVYTSYRPALGQPVPIAVPWAPPPMRVESPPSPPSPDARWTGGYWVWHERWEWAPGRWAEPPRPRYHWVPPYYEHRRDRVVFVDGFWSPPGVAFVPPPPALSITLAVIGAGIALGHAPVGPEGVFVPPPPGSRRGLIVMAPVGTAPAVVTRAPPIIAPGMRVTNTTIVRNEQRTTIVDNHRDTNVVNNITNVTIEAPAGSTADHRPVRQSVPAQAHLAAALPAAMPEAPARRVAPPPQAPQRPTLSAAPALAPAPVPAPVRAPTPAPTPRPPTAAVERPPADRHESHEPEKKAPMPVVSHEQKIPARVEERPTANVAEPHAPPPAKSPPPVNAHRPDKAEATKPDVAKGAEKPHRGADPNDEAKRHRPHDEKAEPAPR